MKSSAIQFEDWRLNQRAVDTKSEAQPNDYPEFQTSAMPDMKITFVGHAALMVECGGIRILSDPWWKTPCFGKTWWAYPLPDLTSVRNTHVDYVYISHGHHDHLHYPTLGVVDRDATVLVAQKLGLAQHIRQTTGRSVIEVPDDSTITVGDGVSLHIWPVGHDSIMIVHSGGSYLANLNDALHASSAECQDAHIARIKQISAKIDYMFCGYGTASHFPNCYRVEGKDDHAVAARRQRHFNGQWSRITAVLNPRFAFPFAAGVAFLDDDLFALNATIHNSERPTQRFADEHPTSDVSAIDIAPGFSIEDGVITNDVRFTPVDLGVLASTMAKQLSIANTHFGVADSMVESLAALLRTNVEQCATYLREYSGSYRCEIALRGANESIILEKSGPRFEILTVPKGDSSIINCDVSFSTEAGYLYRSLSDEYGHEILFVGAGCRFSLRNRAAVAAKIHNELRVIVTRRKTPPPSRFGRSSPWMYSFKNAVKRLLGVKPDTLYDLVHWLK